MGHVLDFFSRLLLFLAPMQQDALDKKLRDEAKVARREETRRLKKLNGRPVARKSAESRTLRESKLRLHALHTHGSDDEGRASPMDQDQDQNQERPGRTKPSRASKKNKATVAALSPRRHCEFVEDEAEVSGGGDETDDDDEAPEDDHDEADDEDKDVRMRTESKRGGGKPARKRRTASASSSAAAASSSFSSSSPAAAASAGGTESKEADDRTAATRVAHQPEAKEDAEVVVVIDDDFREELTASSEFYETAKEQQAKQLNRWKMRLAAAPPLPAPDWILKGRMRPDAAASSSSSTALVPAQSALPTNPATPGLGLGVPVALSAS